MNILEEYKKTLKNEVLDDNFPEETSLNENDREKYKETLKKLREDPNDIKNVFENMIKLTEDELRDKDRITEETVTPYVKHAYCECGEELIATAPPMFNPYTLQKICKHICKKCKKTYNLDYSYPRVIYKNNENKEINAFGL